MFFPTELVSCSHTTLSTCARARPHARCFRRRHGCRCLRAANCNRSSRSRMRGHPMRLARTQKTSAGPFRDFRSAQSIAANDHVLAIRADDSNVRKLICIGGLPSMAAVRRDKTEILFLASEDTADVEAEIGRRADLSTISPDLIPHAMALRHIFGEECWHPCKSHASIIIDDPLLRARLWLF